MTKREDPKSKVCTSFVLHSYVECWVQELLEEIYDAIVQEEIVYEDAAMRAEKLREQHSLASVLNLCGAQMRDISNAKEESKELVQGSQTTVRRGGSREGVFLQAKCEDFARPMLETVGWPVLAVFSLTMEDSENKSGMVEGLCIEGFRLGIQLAKTLDMDVMRYAFLTSLVRYPKKNPKPLQEIIAFS